MKSNLEELFAAIGRELSTFLETRRAPPPPLDHRVSLRLLAADMGVNERPLIDAANSGKLKVWRVGRKDAGELVTTRAALYAYLDGQPVKATEESAPTRSAPTENGPSRDLDVDALLRIREVLARIPLSKTSWYRLVTRGEAPAPVHLGSSVFWRAREISAWLASLDQ